MTQESNFMWVVETIMSTFFNEKTDKKEQVLELKYLEPVTLDDAAELLSKMSLALTIFMSKVEPYHFGNILLLNLNDVKEVILKHVGAKLAKKSDVYVPLKNYKMMSASLLMEAVFVFAKGVCDTKIASAYNLNNAGFSQYGFIQAIADTQKMIEAKEIEQAQILETLASKAILASAMGLLKK